MANKTALTNMEIEAKKEIADKDRKQRDRESWRKTATDTLKSGAKLAPFLVGQDPSWYKQWIADLDKYTNLPTFLRVGDPISKYIKAYGEGRLAVPGMCIIEHVTSIGFSNGVGSNPANKSFTRTTTELRRANSRIGAYDPSDIGMYINVTADLVNNIEEAKRAVRLLNTFDASNSYIYEDLMRSLGFNPSTALNNKAEIIMELSTLIKDFNSNVPVPKDMTIYKRKIFLGSTIIRDSKVAKSQYYAYRNACYTTWDDLNNTIVFNNKPTDLLDFIRLLQGEVSALQDTTTMVSLLTDMRTGLPASAFLIIEDVPLGESFKFAESDEVLGQINNTVTIPDFLDTDLLKANPSLFNIKVNSNGFIYQGTYNANDTYESGIKLPIRDNLKSDYNASAGRTVYTNVYLNSYSDNVSGDDNLVNTRNIPIINMPQTAEGSDNYKQCTVEACGTELMLRIKCYASMENSSLLLSSEFHTYMAIGSTAREVLKASAIWSTFDWIPKIQYYDYTLGDNNDNLKLLDNDEIYTLFEYANYYPLPNENLKQLHIASISSEYYISSTVFNRTGK